MKKVLFTLCLLAASECFAGGLTRPGGIGTVGGGTGGAMARGVSLFSDNLAGLLRVKTETLEITADILYPDFDWRSDKLRLRSDQTVYHVMPNLAWIKPVSDDLSLGLGVYTPYGLGAKFNRNFEQLGYDTETLIAQTVLTTGLAFKLSEKVSLGLGLNLGWAQIKYHAPFDLNLRPLPIDTDTEAQGPSLGASLCLAYAPSERLRLSIQYASESKAHLRGETKLKFLGLSYKDEVKTSFTFPAKLEGGIEYDLTKKLTLGAAVKWYGYQNTCEKIVIDFQHLPLRKPRRLDWEDCFGLHAGFAWVAQENLDQKSRLTIYGGVGYMSAAIPNETVSTLTPDINGGVISLAVKREYQDTRLGNLELSLGYLNSFGSRSWDGKTIDATVQSLSASVTFRF